MDLLIDGDLTLERQGERITVSGRGDHLQVHLPDFLSALRLRRELASIHLPGQTQQVVSEWLKMSGVPLTTFFIHNRPVVEATLRQGQLSTRFLPWRFLRGR